MMTSLTKSRISFALSLVTIFFGSIALFTNYWIQGPLWNAGFINVCSFDVCVSIQSTFSLAGPRLAKLGQYYALGITFLIYLPLVMTVIAALLKGVNLYLGKSDARDVSATVCVWIATYHALGLVMYFIVLASMKDEFKPVDKQSDYGEENDYNEFDKMAANVSIGWSAYMGLLAAIIAFASAITSCPVCSKGDKEQTQEDTVALITDAAHLGKL